MTRKYLWGVIIILLITNLTTVAVWMNDRNSGAEIGTGNALNNKDVVASIGNKEITYEMLEDKLVDKYGRSVLKSLIDQEVVQKLADQEGIKINEKLIDREMALLFTMQGVLTPEEIATYRQKWRNEVTHRYLLEALLTKDISITEMEIRHYYDNYKNQYEFKESIQVSHILVDNRETAEKVYRELESGASFATLAREYSVDEESKSDGGYLGFYTNESEFLSDDYYNKAMGMEEDSYSKPFLVGDRVAILYLHRLLPSITFTYEELRANIKRELALEQIEPVVSAEPLWENFDVEWMYQ